MACFRLQRLALYRYISAEIKLTSAGFIQILQPCPFGATTAEYRLLARCVYFAWTVIELQALLRHRGQYLGHQSAHIV